MLPIVVKGAEGLTTSKSARIFLTFSSTYRPNYLTIPTVNKLFKIGLLNEGWQETAKTINVENVFKLTYAPYEDVRLNIAIDESKVEEYNAANGTAYEFKADATLASNSITIGTDGTYASFKINTGDLEGIANEIPYVIPVTISSVDGAVVEFGENSKTVYVVVKGVGRELGFSRNEYSGKLLGNPVSCTVDGNPNYNSYKTWLQIINDYSQYGYLGVNSVMEIDFGKVVKLSSIFIDSFGPSYGATGMKLETQMAANGLTGAKYLTHKQPNTI